MHQHPASRRATLAGRADGSVLLWHGTTMTSLIAHTSEIQAVALGDRHLAAASRRGHIALYGL